VEGSAPPQPGKKLSPPSPPTPGSSRGTEAVGIRPSPGLPESPRPTEAASGAAAPRTPAPAAPLPQALGGGIAPRCRHRRRGDRGITASLTQAEITAPSDPTRGKRTPSWAFLPRFWKPPGASLWLTAALAFQRSAARSQQTASFAVVVAIDFGTTSSGYAFSFSSDPEAIHMMR